MNAISLAREQGNIHWKQLWSLAALYKINEHFSVYASHSTNANAAIPGLNLQPLWIPFTANRQFKAAPRLLVSAKDMYYQTQDGRKLLDGIAGLWAVNAGHVVEVVIPAGSGSQDSVSACSDTAVRGSSSDRSAQSANAPIAYGAVWISAASNVWPLR